MATKAFFPDPVSGTVFFLLLVGVLSVAAYVDLKTLRIPKWLTLPLLGLGILMNVGRGAWLGSLGKPVWVLGADSAGPGALDGLLFALAGAALAFVIYTAFWMLGAVKGGDVKLCTAIGAWLGPSNVVLFLLASAVVLFVLSVVWVMTGGLTTGSRARREQLLRTSAGVTDEKEVLKLTRRGLSFSLTAAIAAALVMMWAFRVDLQLVPAKPAAHKGSTHEPVRVAVR